MRSRLRGNHTICCTACSCNSRSFFVILLCVLGNCHKNRINLEQIRWLTDGFYLLSWIQSQLNVSLIPLFGLYFRPSAVGIKPKKSVSTSAQSIILQKVIYAQSPFLEFEKHRPFRGNRYTFPVTKASHDAWESKNCGYWIWNWSDLQSFLLLIGEKRRADTRFVGTHYTALSMWSAFCIFKYVLKPPDGEEFLNSYLM